MGYSEVVCHICGVTFSIGRLRSLKEVQNPSSDCPDIDAALLSIYLENAAASLNVCEAKEGCMVAIPARKRSKDDRTSDDGEENEYADMKDADSDADYVDRPVKETEPYEFDTPDEDRPEQDSDVEMTDVDGSSDDGSDEEPLWRREMEPANREKKIVPYAEWQAKEKETGEAESEADGEESDIGEDGNSEGENEDGNDKNDSDQHESDENCSDEEDNEDDEDEGNDENEEDDEGGWGDEDGNEQNEDDDEDDDVNGMSEHIPGPKCTNEGGYHGSRISLAEMRGCTIAQVLVPKPEDWTPSDDDEPFERDPDFGFFLSGLCDLVPSRDSNYPSVFPERHGMDEAPADNCLWVEENAAEMGMPFHPTCLEVFKRASLRRNGEVDLRGLMDWFRLEAAFDYFNDIPRSAAVSRGGGQWWCHTKGDEHIVANPCYVPRWDQLLSSSTLAGDSAVVFPQGASNEGDFAATNSDHFTSLPQNVRQRILFHLVSQPRDIANLRLASRAFRQLDQSLFRALLLHKRPWIWEAWCSMPYSFWTTTSKAALKEEDKARQQRQENLENAISVLREEAYAGNSNASAIQTLEAQLVAEKRIPREPVPVAQLQKVGTDWHALYLEIRKPKPKWPKGLRNRRRIWSDCEDILDRIEKNRREGKMGPGITVDPVKTVTDYYARAS